jgi:hypothetical protein
VLENTKHKLLEGNMATEFAILLGNFTIYLGIKSVMVVTSEMPENTKHKLLVGATEFAISLGNFFILLYTKKIGNDGYTDA